MAIFLKKRYPFNPCLLTWISRNCKTTLHLRDVLDISDLRTFQDMYLWSFHFPSGSPLHLHLQLYYVSLYLIIKMKIIHFSAKIALSGINIYL